MEATMNTAEWYTVPAAVACISAFAIIVLIVLGAW